MDELRKLTIEDRRKIDEEIFKLCEKSYTDGYFDGQKDRDMDIPPSIDDAYRRGYADAEKKHNADLDYKNGLEDGRMEAWECAIKINNMSIDECEKIFNEYQYRDLSEVLEFLTASEAIAKMEEWENSWHIKMPFENIHGELYCKYSDVQKLYEQMKGEAE